MGGCSMGGRKRKHKKMKGGFYGFGGDVLGHGGASGAAMWSRSEEVPVGLGDRGGNSSTRIVGNPHTGTQSGGRRRRRHRGGAAEPPNPQAAEMKGAPGGIQVQPMLGGDPTGPDMGGRRRTRHKKTRRRHSKRRHSRRKMRGGTKFGGTYASYVGSGNRGLANVSQGSHVGPGGAGGGAFNNYGATPGGFQSFGGLSPSVV